MPSTCSTVSYVSDVIAFRVGVSAGAAGFAVRGRSTVTHRHIKNNRLANVGWMWAFSAASNCEPARQHYRRRRENGDRHAAATRHLFNKLLGQVHHCLQHHETFDEGKAIPMPLCNAA